MADRVPASFAQKLPTVLRYALPVLGGLIGMAIVNMTAHANPVLGVVIGALGGWGLATILVNLFHSRKR